MLHVLRRVADFFADDQAVLLDSLSQHITPEQAAETLGFPHDYVMTLLESGELPSERKHGARVLSLKNVLTYREAIKQQQREALRGLSQTSPELGLFNLVYEGRATASEDDITRA